MQACINGDNRVATTQGAALQLLLVVEKGLAAINKNRPLVIVRVPLDGKRNQPGALREILEPLAR